jgi:CRP-like cAMP-binding protein
VLTALPVASDVDIVAVTSLEVLVLPKEPMLRVLETCPEILLQLMNAVQRRQRAVSKKKISSSLSVDSGAASAVDLPSQSTTATGGWVPMGL